MCFGICYIEERKMKTVQIGQTRYMIRNKEDAVYVTHELIKKGYTVEEIAKALDVTERTVRKYLSDCW